MKSDTPQNSKRATLNDHVCGDFFLKHYDRQKHDLFLKIDQALYTFFKETKNSYFPRIIFRQVYCALFNTDDIAGKGTKLSFWKLRCIEKADS